VYFPTALWDSLTDRAVIKTTEICSCVVKEDTIVTVNGTREYSLNTDFANILSVLRKTDPEHLKRIPHDQKGQIPFSDPSNPEFYYIKGQKIGLDRTPNKADTMFLAYLSQAKLLTADTDTTNIPSEYANAIAYYMIAEALARAKVYEQATYFRNLWRQEIDEVKASKRFIPQQNVAPKTIIPQ